VHNHDDIDWAELADNLELQGETQTPFLSGAFDQLANLNPQRVLDIGSGPGVAACLLAERFPDADIRFIEGAGHTLYDPGVRDAVMKAIADMASRTGK
jgi:trans-aconitate methyltransferase